MLATANRPKETDYSFSFLAGALFLPESAAIAELMKTHLDWNEVARQTADQNLIRQRTAAIRYAVTPLFAATLTS